VRFVDQTFLARTNDDSFVYSRTVHANACIHPFNKNRCANVLAKKKI